MLEAIDTMAAFVADADRDQFSRDLKTIHAVRSVFITLGEAAGRLPEDFRDAHPDIPWKKVRDFRNFMVHVYDRIDTGLLWDTAIESVPPLRKPVATLIETVRRSEDDERS